MSILNKLFLLAIGISLPMTVSCEFVQNLFNVSKKDSIAKGFEYAKFGRYDSSTAIFSKLFDNDKNDTNVLKGLIMSKWAFQGYDSGRQYLKYLRNNSRFRSDIDTNHYESLLKKIDANSILFVDNDKDLLVLLWLQEIGHVKTNMSVVNVPFLNYRWYVKGERMRLNLPMLFTTLQLDIIDNEANSFNEPTPYTLPNAGIGIVLPSRAEKHTMYVSDKLLIDIVDANRWKKPIYFTYKDHLFEKYLKESNGLYSLIPQ
jgi:tetratricopeptide (TPR) repeat protein